MKMGDYVKIQTGKLDANAAVENGKYPFFTCAIEPLRIDHYKYDCECVLVAGNGDLNVKYYNGKFEAYQRTYIIESKNHDLLVVPYLYRFLDNYIDVLRKQAIGGVIKYIKLGNLTDAMIPVPTIDKQQAIVERLAMLDMIIANKNKQLKKMDELVKSRFIEMFDGEYPEETLFNLCNIIDYRGKTPEKVESGLPFITAKNVKMHHMALEPREYISKETYDKVMVRGFPKEGDVVFTTEAPLGNVCRIPHFDTEFYIGQRIVTMQTEELNPIYLEYALSAEEFVRRYMRKSSGSTVKGIRVRLLEQLTIPVPLRVLQDDFANFVLQTDKSKYYNFTSYKYCVLAANLIRQEWMLCQTLSF